MRCPRDGVVRVLAVDHDRQLGADALRPRVGQRRGPGREKRDERGLGPAGGEHAARPAAEAGEAAHPPNDLRLQYGADRRHLPDGTRLVEGRRQRLGPHRRGQRGRDLVAHRARVAQAVRVGQDVPSQALEDDLERTAVDGQRLVEPAREVLRRVRGRDGTFARPRRGVVVDGEAGERRGRRLSRVLLDVVEDGVAHRPAG
jgi:hypothetical protein